MAHDAVSSCLGSLSLSQNGWHIRRKISVRGLDKASYPVITYAGEYDGWGEASHKGGVKIV
jgi:hypothetical protein